MYLVGLGMQVLEWRITTSNNKAKYIPENEFPFFVNDFAHMSNKLLNTEDNEHSLFSYPKIRMTWTGNKIDLVELIYAWEEVGCFNHGNVNVKEIVAYIEVVFNIDLGDYYGTFKEMRNRVNRTAFLDKLIKFLNDRMNEVDRKK